jgi:hypothetical protein
MVGKREGEERRGKEMSGEEGEKRGHCRIGRDRGRVKVKEFLLSI